MVVIYMSVSVAFPFTQFEGNYDALDITRMFQSAEPTVRFRAAQYAGISGLMDRKLIGFLVQGLTDTSPDVRARCAQSIAKIGQNASFATIHLAAVGMKDKSPRVRESCALALGHVGDTSLFVIVALGTLLNDDDNLVRLQAGISLGNLGVEAAPSTDLLKRSLRDRNVSVRLSAVLTLERVGKVNGSAVTAITIALNDESSIVREAAVSALGEIGCDSKEVLMALEQVIRIDYDDSVRAEARIVLDKLKKKDSPKTPGE
jgi:HEAT repeat protein